MLVKNIYIDQSNPVAMLSHIEDQYRLAALSEKDYKSLKEKYSNGSSESVMAKKNAAKEEEIEEVTPEVIERLATQLSEQSEQQETQQTDKKKKGGIFGKLFGKKKEDAKKEEAPEEKQETENLVEPHEVQDGDYEEFKSTDDSVLSKKVDGLGVEIEKLKTILETMRETGHVTDETIQAISESIGELRSLVFQNDASQKESMVKIEKIEDDVTQVKPREVEKKFREIDGKLEKNSMEMEKVKTKLDDSNEKINKMYEMLKSIGGIENLVDINRKIQEKLKDVEEAVKYIGRIGAKTEKQFMDLSRGMDDLVMFKAKQEDTNETLKDILKSIDELDVKFEDYVSKKDLSVFKEDMFLLKKQIEGINKIMPVVEMRLPEVIIDLRKEREDILMLFDSLREQYEGKKITKSEYMSFKEGNEKRLAEIEKQLHREWRKLQRKLRQTKSKFDINDVEGPKDVEKEDAKKKMEDVKESFEKPVEKEEPAKEVNEEKPEKPKRKYTKHKKTKAIKPQKKDKNKKGKMKILKSIKKIKV